MALGCASLARAADFDVSPTRLELSAQHRTGHLVVRNPGVQTLRLQVSVKAWRQSVDGAVELDETGDVSFFPSLLELAPGSTRSLRFGVTTGELPREQTWRVLIDELPERSAAGGGVQVVTRLSVPIFFGPAGTHARAAVSTPVLLPGAVQVVVRNEGASRLMATKVVVEGVDALGAPVLSGEAAGWYVLAGGERRFTVPVQGEAGRGATVKVQVQTDSGPVWSEVRLP